MGAYRDARSFKAIYLPVSPRPVMVITSQGLGIGIRS